MNLLPKASASRPRFACEIFPGAVVAARSPGPGLPLAATARVTLPEDALAPGLKPGNLPDRVAVIAAIRRALEQIGARPNARNTEITLILPDAAVRVLLLDFDALPSKLTEALPIVRFRLKKLVPFDADEAMVSFQTMSSTRSLLRVLAVAIPRDILAEYETAVREAGFEPGAVLPSTLAALATLNEADPDAETAALLVNANPLGVTTAIVRAGVLLLHRAIELTETTPSILPPTLFEPAPAAAPETFIPHSAHTFDIYAAEAAPIARSPYASPSLQQQLDASFRGETYFEPPIAAPESQPTVPRSVALADPEPPIHTLAPDLQQEEIARAVSVAIAYFEDTLAAPPGQLLSAGPLGAEALHGILRDHAVTPPGSLAVCELLDPAALAQTSTAIPSAWLAGVAGALRS